jgi:dTMP kinase
MKRGCFITIEGIEGAGKSTVVQFIKDYLSAHKIECVLTREFGGTEIAEKIRHILLNQVHQEKMCSDTEILLAFAQRAQHLARLILPSLEAGKWVLCDRFTDSTYAYQGSGRGVPLERIAIIEEWVQCGLQPDYTLLLDLDVGLGLHRVKKRQVGLDRIESEELHFFERVRQGYLERAKQYPKRFRVIDAALPQEQVLAKLEQVLAEILATCKSSKSKK